MLLHHPDKQGGHGGEVDIRVVNEAKWILEDPARRKEWEANFHGEYLLLYSSDCVGRMEGSLPQTRTPHVTQLLSLSEFVSHNDSYYTHPCRCSGEFVITHEDLEAGVDVVGCGGCGEWVGVGYEVVQEECAGDVQAQKST